MNLSKSLTSLALLLGAGSCALPSIKALPPQAADLEPITSPVRGGTQTPRTEQKLYARDGSVIGEQVSGTTAVVSNAGQSASADGHTRWTLLEQYQAALSGKEELQFEIQAMAKELEQSESREASLATAGANLQNELNAMVQNVAKLKSHNVELAARLTTAQIRRLQSEKLLLEAKLEWRRIEATINGPGETSTESPLGKLPPVAGTPVQEEPIR